MDFHGFRQPKIEFFHHLNQYQPHSNHPLTKWDLTEPSVLRQGTPSPGSARCCAAAPGRVVGSGRRPAWGAGKTTAVCKRCLVGAGK